MINLKKIIHSIKLIPAKIKDFFVKIKIFFDEFPEKTNSRSDLSTTNINVRKLKKGIKDKNINTIALLGNFSSGKSSIVFSSLKKSRTIFVYPNEKFYEPKKSNESKNIILQCLIKSDVSSISPKQETYRKYIKRKKIIKLYLIAFFICLFCSITITFFLYIYSNKLKYFISNVFEINIKNYWYIIFPFFIYILICILGTIHICNYCISLKMNGLEITNKSNELEEESVFTCIIFHLLRRKIKNIVFEDLDRNNFNKELTYEKFRELRDFCLKINSSPQIKKSIKFIYCFSDKIFQTADERLKSFDLIIPIFPKMTMNNSYEDLCKQDIIIEKNISINELANLSIFISDKRLYNSIISEFRLMCEQILSNNYNEMFALCCIKNIYPKLYYALHINNNFADIIINNMNGDISNFEKFESELSDNIKLLLDNVQNEELKNAKLLIKICIKNKYLTSDYKSILHSGKNFLNENDTNYLKKIAAMEETDPNLKLTNFEMILERVANLSNPKFFNISLMQYCMKYEKKNQLREIIESLGTSTSNNAINSILNYKDIKENEILYLNTNLAYNSNYVECVVNSTNNRAIHNLLYFLLKNKVTKNSQIPPKADTKIKDFYYINESYFVGMDTKICLFILQNYPGVLKRIPLIKEKEKKEKVYNMIITYNRYEITLDNFCCFFSDFKKTPLKYILSNNYIYSYIGNKIDCIKDLINVEDSIIEVIKLFKNKYIDHSLLLGSKYIEQFYFLIDVKEDNYSIIDELMKFNLLTFTNNSIIKYINISTKENKYEETINFIVNSIEKNIPYKIISDERFDETLSRKLLTSLPLEKISIIKDSIDVLLFNSSKTLSSFPINIIKMFEANIKLSKEIITDMLYNNPNKLKDIFDICPSVAIDKSNCSYDKEKLKIAKKYKINKIYCLFKENNSNSKVKV